MNRVRQSIGLFFCWVAVSVRKPDNFPHYLTALFTLLLVCFAYRAWDESTRATAALQGQLGAMLAERRPYIAPTENLGAPQLYRNPSDGSGQIGWQFHFRNYGGGIATKVTFKSFIKVGRDAPFKPPYGGTGIISKGIDMAPTNEGVSAVASDPDPGLTQDTYDKLLMTDRTIGVLVEFEYCGFDDPTCKTKTLTSGFCMEHLALGGIALRQPEECKKQ